MTIDEIRSKLKQENLPDQWWVAQNGDTLPEQKSLKEIIEGDALSTDLIQIMNVSNGSDWVILESSVQKPNQRNTEPGNTEPGNTTPENPIGRFLNTQIEILRSDIPFKQKLFCPLTAIFIAIVGLTSVGMMKTGTTVKSQISSKFREFNLTEERIRQYLPGGGIKTTEQYDKYQTNQTSIGYDLQKAKRLSQEMSDLGAHSSQTEAFAFAYKSGMVLSLVYFTLFGLRFGIRP